MKKNAFDQIIKSLYKTKSLKVSNKHVRPTF